MKQAFSESIHRLEQNRYLPALILAVVVLAHLLSVLSLNPPCLFGLSQDDTLYFSSAKALAEGRGYILPSLPGSPAATKYPILYPWLLSFVWRLQPNFPANLSLAVALTYFFSLAAIFLVYFFCRSPLRLPRLQSLAITAFFALHPDVIFYSARVMSDIPFAALTLAFLLLAWRATEGDTSRVWPILAGLSVSLCVLMRLAGVAYIVGAVAALLLRRLWKSTAAFLAASSPGILYFFYQSFLRVPSAPPVPFSPQYPGWQQTWYYYTSYTAFRHLDSPDLSSFLTLFLNQILYLVSAIAGYFIAPLSDANIALWFLATLLFFVLFATALCRRLLSRSPDPAPAILLAYTVLLVTWDHVEWARFLLPFFPWIVAGIVREARDSWAKLRAAGGDLVSNSLRVCVAFCAAGLIPAIAWNYAVTDRRSLAETRRIRETTFPEKEEAYRWLRAYTAPGDPVIATEDGLAYFYTGHQSISAAIFAPHDVYDTERFKRDLDHIADVPVALNARYWVITDKDSFAALHALGGPVKARLEEFQSSLPLLFQSRGGTVRVYDARCLEHARTGCGSNLSQSEAP